LSRNRQVILIAAFVGLLFFNFSDAGRARAASPPATPETISLLVIIIDFLDEPRPNDLRYKDGVDHFVPLTVANAEDVFFDNSTSTAERYLEMSNSLMTITGDVVDVALNMNIGTSGLDDWRLAADAESALEGFDPANYDRIGYVLAYGFENQIRTGGAVGNYFWATGVDSGNAFVMEYVFNHELGHTLDLEHAGLIDAGGLVISTGDVTDFMGTGDGIHANAVNKYYKGWLDGVRNTDHPVDTSATYNIYPLADTGSATLQTVVIDSHGAQSSLNAPFDTFVSYRRPINFDDDLSLVATDPYGTLLRDTVHVHYARKSGNTDSYMDRALDSGDSYNGCGQQISVTSINPQRAQVQITQTPYSPVAPDIVPTAVGATSVMAGTAVLYDLTVTNNDAGTGACEAFYDHEFVGPQGWFVGWVSAGTQISVAAGQSEVFDNFSILAPVGTAPGMYNVSFKLTNNGGSGGPVETTVMLPYEVQASPDVTPPSAPTNLLPDEMVGTAVILTWTASTDDVGVHTYLVYHNSTLLPDGGNNTTYVDFPPPSGGYTQGGTNGYVVYAVDAAGNVSPPSNWVFVGDDLIPPSTPLGLAAAITSGMVALDWDDSTDNVGVTGYDIHRDSSWVGTSTISEWNDVTAVEGNVYTYTVSAWDGFGNESAESAPVFADTSLPDDPPPDPEFVPSLSPGGMLLQVIFMLGATGIIRWRSERRR